jgi:hypothetical protein
MPALRPASILGCPGFLEDVAKNLPVMERTGRFPAVGGPGPEWLAFCRRRIAALTGQTARSADA